MLDGDFLRRAVPAGKKKPVKKKAAPKRPAPAPRGSGIIGVSRQVATRQTTPQRVVSRTQRAGRPAPAAPARQAPSAGSRSLDEAFAKVFGKSAPARPKRPVSTGGLNPAVAQRLQLLNVDTPDSFVGGLVKNTARGGLDIITGLPAAGQLVGENIAAFNPATMTARGLHEAGAPGLQWTEDYQGRVAGIDKRAGRAVADSYAYQYGPLLRGDVREFGRRAYQNPLGVALDVTGAYGVAGRVGNIGSRITRAVAPESQAAARASRRLSISPAVERATWEIRENLSRAERGLRQIPFAAGEGGRYRPPRVYRSETPAKGGRVAVAEARVDRRPYSANRITASIQRRRDAGIDARQQRIDRIAAREPSGVPVLGAARNARTRLAQTRTSEARFQKNQGKAARETRYMSERRAEAMIANTPEYQKFVRATRNLKKDKTPAGVPAKGLSVEEYAVSLHLDDLVDARGGMTPRQLRDQAVENARKEQGKLDYDVPGARRNVEQIENIPDHLLTLKASTPEEAAAVERVKVAVQAGRDLDRVNQIRSRAAGVVTDKTAEAIKGRVSSVVLGGSRWLPHQLREMKEMGFGRKQRAEYRGINLREDPPEGWMDARRAVYEADQRLKAASTGGTATEVRVATRALDKAKKRLDTLERKAGKRMSLPGRPELVGTKGTYRPHRAVDNPSGKSPHASGRGMSGPQKAKQSHGTLAKILGYDMNPALLAHQAKRAAGNVTGPMSPRALNELIGTAAYRVDGKLARGKRAYQLMVNSPEKVVLVNAGTLKKALGKLDKLEDGKTLDDVDVRMFYGEKPGKGQDWLQELKANAVSDEYVAISRSAAEAWRESMTAPWKWLEKYDNALDLWKGGLLALSPRWYVNNIFGLAFQYGLVSGGDIRAMVRANRSPEIKRAIAAKNPDVAVATLADEVVGGMMDSGKIENAGALVSTIRGGFKLNNKIEASWRRATYLNRAKKAMRDEGGRFRGMSDAEIAQAIDRMPPSVARNIVRDVDFYIGEYGRYNQFERQFLKRIIPFYSWLRVISKLTFGLPFRSPVRAAALAVLSKAGTAGLNPDDYMLPAYARGALRFGDVRVPTWSINPAQTVVPFLEGLGENNAIGGVTKASVGWLTPAMQLPINQGFGLNNFGEGVFAPPGAGGTAQQFGRDPQVMNSVTGMPQDTNVRIPWSEAFIQTAVPGIAGPLRRALVGEETAYDTTTLQDLLGLTGKPREEMFYQRKGPRARQPTALNPITSYLGIPTYEQDDALVQEQYLRALEDFREAVKQTEKRKKKMRRP